MSDPAVLDLRAVFGVRATVTTSTAETGGAYVEMDCVADPGAAALVHQHPDAEEEFRVLEGAMEVLRDGGWRALPAGETHTVPKGAVHGWRNATDAPVRFANVHRPALGFQAHLETVDRLAREGKIRGTADPRSLIHLSMSAVRHRPDVAVRPPQWVVETMARIGRLLRFRID